jgi:hypothetical protein
VKYVSRLWYLQAHQPQAFSSCRQKVAVSHAICQLSSDAP